MTKKMLANTGQIFLICLALIGWLVLSVQKPNILVAARLRYNLEVEKGTDLSAGPCLGKIAPDWVLDISHLPRKAIDNLKENQCPEYQERKVRHFVEMSPQGEIITLE